jgi:hypothetical protein
LGERVGNLSSFTELMALLAVSNTFKLCSAAVGVEVDLLHKSLAIVGGFKDSAARGPAVAPR